MSTRERLAEALGHRGGTAARRCRSHGGGECNCPTRHVLDALLPVVESIADERAAEALEQAMRDDRTTVAKLSPVERLTCFLVKGEDLLARAAALRASSQRETT